MELNSKKCNLYRPFLIFFLFLLNISIMLTWYEYQSYGTSCFSKAYKQKMLSYLYPFFNAHKPWKYIIEKRKEH
jgi:hypothetical protein